MARIPANNNQPSATNHSFYNCPFIPGIDQPNYQLPPNPTLQDLVDGYIEGGFQAHLERVLDVFRQCPDFVTVVSYAGLAKCPVCNRTYPHQTQVYNGPLQNFSSALCQVANKLQGARNFEDLWNMVDSIAQTIRGIGNLTCYDAALRISAKLNILPKDKVYAFNGATIREGRSYKNNIPVTAFNPIITKALTAYQIEDFLCVYHQIRYDDLRHPTGPRVLR